MNCNILVYNIDVVFCCGSLT